jgi:deoxyadenosine/deoxycytidine kinase
MEGKVIAIVGAPGSGKSYLAKKLAEAYHCAALYEGESRDFPDRIKENFRTGRRLYENLVWFRNRQIEKYLEAMELKKSGNYVVLDTFWLTYLFHVPPYTRDNFERTMMLKVAELDRRMLPWPDVVIYLNSTEETMKRYMEKRNKERYWEKNEDFVKLMLKVREEHEKFFKKPMKNLITVEREKVDFDREEDFNKLLKEIDALLIENTKYF